MSEYLPQTVIIPPHPHPSSPHPMKLTPPKHPSFGAELQVAADISLYELLGLASHT